MIELAEIFRRYGPQYRAKFGERIPWRHRQAMEAIERCRTEAMGGHIYYCDNCDEALYHYHSCKNRHCPKCQHQTAQQWLIKQQALLLPQPHFMVTFTIPDTLRPVARSHQTLIYNLLFRTAAAALQQLALDPRFVGGQIGIIGVLQTWGRNLSYHPHVHFLVPAGGVAPDGQHWRPARNAFLVHVKPLSRLFRAKFRDELKKTALYDQIPVETWSKEWIVHCKSVGSGVRALRYLARYVFQVAISNNRILTLEHDQVTFRYKDTATGKMKYCTLAAEEFMRRFLQHVLPKGFVKVRYYGFFGPGKRQLLHQVQQLMVILSLTKSTDNLHNEPVWSEEEAICCPKCGRVMRLIETVKPRQPP
jgi:hypothetical protein